MEAISRLPERPHDVDKRYLVSRAAKSLEQLALALDALLDQIPESEQLHSALLAAADLGAPLAARSRAVGR